MLTKLAQLLVIIVAAAGAGFAVEAMTSSSTVPASSAGSGSAAISGYTATSVAYSLNAATPTNFDALTFTLNPTTATTVKVQLAAAGTWYSCTNTAGSVSCDTTSPQATVAGATQLTVLATA